MNKEEKEVAGAELLEELGSKNQELELKDKELTKVCSQLAVRGEETAAAATAAPPVDSRAEVRAAEMEQDRETMGEWAAGAEARTQEQAAPQQERDQAVGQLEGRLGALEAQATPLGRAEELTAPSRDQRSPSIQESPAMDSMQSLSVDDADLVEEGYQDDWKTTAWRNLARFLMLGSYLLGAAAEFSPEKALLPDLGPSLQATVQLMLFLLAARAMDILHSPSSPLDTAGARCKDSRLEFETQWMCFGSAHRLEGSLMLAIDGPDTDVEPKALGESHAQAKLDLAHINPLSQPKGT